MNGYIILLLILIPLCSVLFAGICVFQYRRKMQKEYQRLLEKMDYILAGKKEEDVYDESFSSAITERLERIMCISRAQKGKAEEERDIVKAFISNVSHQIRTPLSNIILYTELLKNSLADASSLQLAQKVEKNAEKLEFFMKELLKSSYAEQELILLHPKMVSLDTLIKRGCQLVEMEAMKKHIALTLSIDSYLVFADPKWTEEVFANILENAIKYSPEGSVIQIATTLYESFVCVCIKDTGIGIPEEEQGKVFQRFYRGSNVTDKQGVGIGLYLAREVLAKQRGYIKIRSQINKGTAVSIFLSRTAV